MQHICYVEIITRFTCLLESKPVKQKVSQTVIFPLQTRWVFSFLHRKSFFRGKQIWKATTALSGQKWKFYPKYRTSIMSRRERLKQGAL